MARARAPVVIDFVAVGEDTLVELYLGASPVVKLPLSKEMVEAGLGEVMASEEVVKVVLKVDTEATQQALKALTRLGVRVAGVFDLESAAKFADYAEVGWDFLNRISFIRICINHWPRWVSRCSLQPPRRSRRWRRGTASPPRPCR